MAISVTHSFTSPKADGTDSTLVNPSNWNAQHVTTLAQGNVLGRALGTNGAMQELPLSVDASLQSLTPPVGTTAQRPVTPTSGMMRYNTTTARVEAYQGGIWINYAGALVSTTTPGSPQNGDLWYNPTTALFQIYSGSSWVASATNPAAVAFTGGTMAGVAVTGGSDNNTPIGQTTPAAGSFTTFGAESLLPVLTTGTLTAYLVAMTPVLTVAPPYLALSVVFHATSGAAPTLDFGAGAKPLVVRGVSGLAAPPTGSLKIGSTVTMVYDGTNCVILDQQFALNGDTTSVGIPVDPAFTNAAISTAIAAIPAPTLGTLLGTLTTTSGTVQTLSGLTLTPYSQLFIVVDRKSVV